MASSSSSTETQPVKKQKLLDTLARNRSCTRTALVQILQQLHEGDLLSEGFGVCTESALRKSVARRLQSVSQESTPYGTLIQSFEVDAPGCARLEYINPFAFLYHVGSLYPQFFALLCNGRNLFSPMKLVFYIDEACPGNPLRPDKSRTTQCLYWNFADLPGHILVRSGFWFLFIIVRSTIVLEIPGKVSGLMRKVLRIFSPPTGVSFQRGVLLKHGERSFLFTAVMSGFIADEKALKEILAIKGASGTKPCPTCQNVVQFMDTRPPLVGIECADYALLQYHTNDTFYEMIDRLRAARLGGVTKAALARMEQAFGLHADEHNILFDHHLRQIVKPVDHCLRDWMHTFVSNGIAGIEMAMLVGELVNVGITNTMLIDYAALFRLPKALGKVDNSWFTAHRITSDHCRTFASDQLNMLPILHAFLEDVVRPTGQLSNNIKCFTLLRRILEILCKGPEKSLQHVRLLRESIVDHHVLFATLYPSGVRPKLHQALHIPENMQSLGALLSCFPTERKHRTVKSAALHVFRHYEHTVLLDMLHVHIDYFSDETVYEEMCLRPPLRRWQHEGLTLLRSETAQLPCGEVRKGDLVLCRNGDVAEVLAFWTSAGVQIATAQLSSLSRTAHASTWHMDSRIVMFAEVAEIVDTLMWALQRPGVIRVILPLV